MKNRLTLFIYSDTGKFARIRIFSARTLKMLAGGAMVLAMLFTYLLYDYISVKNSRLDSLLIEREVTHLRSELDDRDRQIEIFHAKIDSLQLKMIKLNQLEQKIRNMAEGVSPENLEISGLGVGGTSPDDLDERFDGAKSSNDMIQDMVEEVRNLNQAAISKSEDFKALWDSLNEIRKLQDATPSIRPFEGGWISSNFGYRKSPFTGKKEFHTGLDIATRKGTLISATAGGIVTFTGSKGYLGKAVIIDHGYGIKTRYGHMSRIYVATGQPVKRGDVIGEVGSTGRSTGPHLHYEVRLNDIPVDARKYLNEYVASSDSP